MYPCAGRKAAEPNLDLERLARLYGRSLYAWAVHLTGDATDAWDLVQDTYERALRGAATPVPPEKERAWLFVIVKNLFRDRWRARRRRSFVDLAGDLVDKIPAPEPDEPPAWATISADDVRRCVGHLGPRLRNVYEMHALQGLSYAEIADKLDVPACTVGTRLHRARQRLKEVLGAQALAA